MNHSTEGTCHRAPWGKALCWSSAGLVLLSVLMVAGVSFLPHGVPGWVASVTRWAGLVLVPGSLPFMIRGYVITDKAILIQRLFWVTCLDLSGLKSATSFPKAMSKSLRVCGNGGGFSFTGWYWNNSLGRYRAFVTDLNNTVVLQFEKRTVVVSPGDPENFVKELVS